MLCHLDHEKIDFKIGHFWKKFLKNKKSTKFKLDYLTI